MAFAFIEVSWDLLLPLLFSFYSCQINPPRDAAVSWYTTVALEKMKQHGAIYLTPFSHRLSEEVDNPEYQRLRCRVNYHALRFKPQIMKLSQSIVDKLRTQGHFMSIHLRFEMDMLAFAGYVLIKLLCAVNYGYMCLFVQES